MESRVYTEQKTKSVPLNRLPSQRTSQNFDHFWASPFITSNGFPTLPKFPNLFTTYSKTIRPLLGLIKCQTGFNVMKPMVTLDLVLTHYDPSLPLKLGSDASPYGLGAVISHVTDEGEKPIPGPCHEQNSTTLSWSRKPLQSCEEILLLLV